MSIAPSAALSRRHHAKDKKSKVHLQYVRGIHVCPNP
jgi:hypothetical protein